MDDLQNTNSICSQLLTLWFTTDRPVLDDVSYWTNNWINSKLFIWQEFYSPRVELDQMMKPPPEERLI